MPPRVLDVFPMHDRYVVAHIDSDTGEPLPPSSFPLSQLRKVVAHLAPGRTVPTPAQQVQFMRLVCAQIKLSVVSKRDPIAFLDQHGDPPMPAHPVVKDVAVRFKGVHEAPWIYQYQYGLDHMHAWLEIEYLDGLHPDRPPVAYLAALEVTLASAVSAVEHAQGGRYALSRDPYKALLIAGEGTMSKTRATYVRLTRDEPVPTMQDPLSTLCMDLEWDPKTEIPHLMCCHWTRGGGDNAVSTEFALTNNVALADVGAAMLSDHPFDALFAAAGTPTAHRVDSGGRHLLVYAENECFAAACRYAVSSLACVVAGKGIRGGDFRVLNKLCPGLLKPTGVRPAPGEDHWTLQNWRIAEGNWSVYVDLHDAQTEAHTKDASFPLAAERGAHSERALDMPWAPGKMVGLGLEDIAQHMLGRGKLDFDHGRDAVDPVRELAYCYNDARLVADILEVYPRHKLARFGCHVAGAHWHWLSGPASARPPAREQFVTACLTAACMASRVLAPLPPHNAKRKYPSLGGVISPKDDPGADPDTVQFDVSRAYSSVISDVPFLLIDPLPEVLEATECRVHQVAPRDGHEAFKNMYVVESTCPGPSVSPMQRLMSHGLVHKLAVNALIGVCLSGRLGHELHALAHQAVAVTADAMKRLQAHARVAFVPCLNCTEIHRPGVDCGCYDPSEVVPLCPLSTDEIRVSMPSEAVGWAQHVLQGVLDAEPLSRKLRLKPAECSFSVRWQASVVSLRHGAPPSELQRKGSGVNSQDCWPVIGCVRGLAVYIAGLYHFARTRECPEIVSAADELRKQLMRAVADMGLLPDRDALDRDVLGTVKDALTRARLQWTTSEIVEVVCEAWDEVQVEVAMRRQGM